MKHESIAFIGSGHGGMVALKSLQTNFSSIEVITDNENIYSLLRKSDYLYKSIVTCSSTETCESLEYCQSLQYCNSIESCKSNLIICANYQSIIPKYILEKKTVINTHPALLPKYRGIHSLVWAMLNSEKEIGFTIHLMNEHMDDGDILEQFKVQYKDQTSYEIMQLFDEYVENNLGRVVAEYLEGEIIPLKQDRKNASWVSRRNISDCVIDFNKSNEYIRMLFKALVRPYPLPMLNIKKKLYEVPSYKMIDNKYEMHNGRVVNIEEENVFIKTKEGILIIVDLIDFETKEIIKARNILRLGQRL